MRCIWCMLATAVLMGVLAGSTADAAGESGQDERPWSESFAIDAGIRSADDVLMVVYHYVADGYLPISDSEVPIRMPDVIVDRQDIAAIHDSLVHVSGGSGTRFARNHRLAVVARNGRVMVFGVADAGVLGYEVAFGRGSDTLGEILWPAVTRARALPQRSIPCEKILSLTYNRPDELRQVTSPVSQDLQELCCGLLQRYNPYTLKWNRQAGMRDMENCKTSHPRYVLIKWVKPVTFGAIVTLDEPKWPPDEYNTGVRLEKFTADAAYVFSERYGSIEFAFVNTYTRRCLLSSPVTSQVQERQQPDDGVAHTRDWFEELAAAMCASR